MSSFKVRKDQRLSAQYLTIKTTLLGKGCSRNRLSPFWARNAIFHGLRALNVSPEDRVLVPSYICRAAVEPIVAVGAKVDFYRVSRDCRVDLEDVAHRMTPSTKALLAVHYFGFPQDIEGVQALCRKNGLSLIEDCAHVLEGHCEGRPLGSFGDVSVFSWRKFLPVYDGADLVFNNEAAKATIPWEREDWIFTIKVAKNLLEDALGVSISRPLRFLSSHFRGTDSQPISSLAPAIRVTPNTDSFDPRLVYWSMSRLSRWVKAYSDIPAIVRARRENYRYLHERLSKRSGLKLLHSQLPEGACPWVLPLVFEEIKDAHLMLREMGIPAVTWGGVRPSFLGCGEYPDAEFLYDKLVFLPVHQSLTRSDLDLIIEAVTKIK